MCVVRGGRTGEEVDRGVGVGVKGVGQVRVFVSVCAQDPALTRK